MYYGDRSLVIRLDCDNFSIFISEPETLRIGLLTLFVYQGRAVVVMCLSHSGYGVMCLPGKTCRGPMIGAASGI